MNRKIIPTFIILMLCGGCTIKHKDVSGPKEYSYVQTTCHAEKAWIRKQAKDLLLQGKFDRLTELSKQYRESKETLSDGSWKLIHFYEGFRGKDATEWTLVLDRLEEWSKSELVDPSPIIAMGDAYWGFGKQARGNGFADTVTEEGWRLLRERLTKGRDRLLADSERCRACPGFYVVMLKIGIDGAQDRESFMQLFEQGIDLVANCPHLYEMKAYYILPRWYGNDGELRKFVRATAARNPEMALWVLWRLQYQGVYQNVFEQESIEWAVIKARLMKCIAGDPVKIGQANMLAYLADIVGDSDTRSAALKSVCYQLDASMWRSQKRLRQIATQGPEGTGAPLLSSPAPQP